MSRCLPYPPPGYSLSRSSNEALIESIKLQKEREKSKEQRKEKKREKKEKKEKKKEKHEKTKEKKDKTTKKLDTLNTQVVKKVCGDTKVNFLLKTRETETKQLERSNLTSEHGEPIPLDGPSTSFDSTENSNKRKRQPSPPVVDCSRRHAGKIIRIRLTSKKQNESNTPAVEHCSTSGRSDFPAGKEDANIGQPVALKIERERICAPQPVVAIAPCKTKNPSIVDAVMTPMQRAELEYKNLIVDWTPPQLQDTYLDQDSDWLFSSKKPDVCAEKRQKCGDDRISCSSSSALYPRAQYLNEVGIYALPFTVPF